MNEKRFFLAFLTLFAPLSIFAQNCPQGIPQGTPSCVPPDQLGYPNAPPVNTAYWKKTWGAIAESPFAIGTSTGHFSRNAASKEAMNKCKARGGNECKIVLTYRNQCSVIAQPIDNKPPIVSTFHSAETVNIATQTALPYCSNLNAGKACEIAYSNCTEPVLIR
ncbi:DUF4189 domain-containing protein [Acinetobacter bereziniae]|uniref:DUF4189 domain-containing protein n=1 Tax=Acinetobacter bereziniae TaxID=106648 RepID=UPI0018DB1943|nr:DUF4189 domain-containing protein [Acinetobacter bereziniae]MBI0395822.1 DUF4189 domain-containing protein [Acinetobacter bereziniae]